MVRLRNRSWGLGKFGHNLSVVPAKAGTHTPCPLGSSKGRTSNRQIGQIAPFEIFLLDELNLPFAFPPLQLLLATDRLDGGLIRLHMYQVVNFVSADELRTGAQSVLLEASRQVVRHSDVQRPVPAAGQNVDVER